MNDEVEMISVPRHVLDAAVDNTYHDNERMTAKRIVALTHLRGILSNTPSKAELEQDNRDLQARDDSERQEYLGDEE
ncbi:hypothetical protein D3C80_1449570 [compost metagenome]